MVALAVLCGVLLPGQTADRKIAEWTLSMGGRVRLAGGRTYVQDLAQLPSGDLRVVALDWVGMNVDPPDLERLIGLRALRELHLPGPLWNRNADTGRDGSRDLKYLAPVETLEVLTFSFHFLDRIRFKDAGLGEIGSLVNLRELVLRQSDVRGHTLQPFHKLQALDCTLCPLDNEGLGNVAAMSGMQRLRIGDTQITDAGMPVLKGLTQLEELDLHGTAITDVGLSHIAGLRRLKKLNLAGTGISDAGIEVLRGLTELEELNLYRTKVSNAGLDGLRGLKKLLEADVRYSRVTPAGVESLRAGLPSVRVLYTEQAASSAMTDAQLAKLPRDSRTLNLEGAQISDAGLRHVARLTNLEELNLSNTSVSDAGLAHLAGLQKLRKVVLANTYVEGEGLAHLKSVADLDVHGSPLTNGAVSVLAGLTGLRRLSLASTDISDGAALDQLKSVVALDLGSTDLTDSGLKALASLPQLEELILRDARFTDKGLVHLAGLKNLRRLDLIRTRISDQGMRHLTGLSSLRSLSLDYGELYDASMEILAALDLEELSLDNTHITDQAVARLKEFRHLKKLNLYHTLITGKGYQELQTALPNCKIVFDAASSLPNRRRS
ncbi:MAG TPA: hypothetical protein VM120_02960 [Bryobacteraceae bacterium]|nr:hypothetical protein [Bryobacteraceae bacterium]